MIHSVLKIKSELSDLNDILRREIDANFKIVDWIYPEKKTGRASQLKWVGGVVLLAHIERLGGVYQSKASGNFFWNWAYWSRMKQIFNIIGWNDARKTWRANRMPWGIENMTINLFPDTPFSRQPSAWLDVDLSLGPHSVMRTKLD